VRFQLAPPTPELTRSRLCSAHPHAPMESRTKAGTRAGRVAEFSPVGRNDPLGSHHARHAARSFVASVGCNKRHLPGRRTGWGGPGRARSSHVCARRQEYPASPAGHHGPSLSTSSRPLRTLRGGDSRRQATAGPPALADARAASWGFAVRTANPRHVDGLTYTEGKTATPAPFLCKRRHARKRGSGEGSGRRSAPVHARERGAARFPLPRGRGGVAVGGMGGRGGRGPFRIIGNLLRSAPAVGWRNSLLEDCTADRFRGCTHQ
jgi:hypothetical protein